MEQHQSAWNKGDLKGLLAGYWRDNRLRYAFNDEVHRGYAHVEASFLERYPNPSAMGELAFSDIEISVPSNTDALVFGRWMIEQANMRLTGLMSVHFRNIDSVWLIVSDHTSSG